MNRFEELKAKGWKNLNQEEKTEYQALKPKDEEVKKSETITLTKDDLRKLLAEAREEASEGLEEVKRLGQWMQKKDLKKANPVATMRLYREDGLAEPGLIIDWKFIKNIENVDTRKMDVPVYQITVKYDNNVKKYEIPLEEMVRINEFEKVEIIKQNVDIQEMKQGVGHKPHTNSGYSFSSPGFFGTKQVGAGEEFDYVVTRKDITCTIKRPNGEVLDIHSSKLNQ